MLKALVISLCLLLTFAGLSFAAQADRLFDSFGNINCEDEMAHLDNVAVVMQEKKDLTAYIFVYAGKRSRRGEAGARLTRIKNYLIERRGIGVSRIKIEDGGYREELVVDVYLIAPGAAAPVAAPTVNPKEVKFRKGKIKKWEYRCNI
jgi:hypothetical protein